jgi:hypothetical protein
VAAGAGSKQRTRRITSLVLLVSGAVILFVGGITLYLRQEVFDSESFAAHASESLGDDRVGLAVADPITDEVIANGPDQLINARPVVESGVQGVIESRPFRDLFQDAAARAHRTLFSRDRDELVLNLADTGAFVIDAVKSISPQIAKQIPKDIKPGLIEVTRSNFAIGAVQFGESIRFLGLFLPALGILMLAGSVAVAVERRGALLRVSAVVAIAAALGFIALLVGRSILLARFDDDLVHDAVDAAWSSYLGGLQAWFLGVGVAAIALAAAASTAGEVDIDARIRRFRDRIERIPETPARRALRAVALLLVGVFVFLEPDLALNIVAVVLGALLFYYALTELLLLIAPAPAEAPERVPLRRRIDPRAAVVGAAVLAAAVAITVALLTGGGGPAKRPGGPIEACNGYAELCDRQLNEVAFPGAHNAMSAADADFFAPNQETGIPKQLDRGARALLIDAHYGTKLSSGDVVTDIKRERGSKARQGIRDQFGKAAVKRVEAIGERVAGADSGGERGTYLCHVVCELGATELTQAFTDVREFLDTHPDEFLIVVIEDYVAPEHIRTAFEDAGLVRYAYVHERDTPFPTLRRLIRADKRILVMAENDNGNGSIPWYHDGFELMQETPYTFGSADELRDPKSCKPNRGTAHSPLFQFNHWVEKLPRSPDLGAQVNAYDFLLQRARECRQRRGLVPNLIAVDFYDEGDVLEAARKLNRLKRNAEPEVRETN